MYNAYDDELEVFDMEDMIEQKQALVEEAKKIPEDASWNEVFHQISDLKRKWKRIPYGESAFEESLEKEFDACLDTFYAKRNEGYQNNQQLKQELVDRAVKLSTSTDWNATSDEMNELMQQWKAAGSAGKDSDDALWDAFQAARQTFYDRKREDWENRKVRFEEARCTKQDLIQEALALKNSENWKETSEQYRILMERWKQAGNAGREHDDRLWNEFQEHRQVFYDKREQYYISVRSEQDEKYERKKGLIAQVKGIVEGKEYTKEHTSTMKNLQVEWKTIGSCGKDKEDQAWQEFRSLMDAYFAGLKEFNDQKHAQWRQKMLDARARKLELIQTQKRQIKYMENEMVGLLGERAIEEMEDEIADKEDFIKELEEQLADIEKTLQGN